MSSVELYCVGENCFGQLGIGAEVRSSKWSLHRFSCIAGSRTDFSQIIKDVQCGGQFSIIIYNNGSLSLCGSLNGIVSPIPRPITIPFPGKCVEIACGRKHVLALMDSGLVLSWGVGYFGQLGHGDDLSWDSPKVITSLEPRSLGSKVTSVICGGSHSAVLTNSGRVFTWGLNKSSQCGIGDKSEIIFYPRPIDVVGLKVKQVVCGRNHSGVLTTEGRVFTWGAASFGRLGLGAETKKSILFPTEISQFRTKVIHSLACGDFHMLALAHDSSVYSWGYGCDGQTGQGNVLHLRTPSRIEALDHQQITEIICGSSYSFAIAKNGTVFGWGYNDGGWLGIPRPDNLPFVEPDDGPPVLRMDTTHCHSFDSRHNVLRPTRLRALSPYHVSMIRAGGAHSIFFCTSRSTQEEKIYEDEEEERYLRSAMETMCLSPSSSTDTLTSDLPSTTSLPTTINSHATIQINCQTKPSLPSTIDVEELSQQLISYCRHRKLPELKYALSMGADINIRDAAGNTPLIVAVQQGHMVIAKFLVSMGANLDAVNQKGNSALHYAFTYGFEELGQFLIDQGANEYLTNDEGLTCYEGLTQADLDRI